MSSQYSDPLLTDLYQLTMANGYWQSGIAERPAVFHLFFRNCPFQGGYAISAGLNQVGDFLSRFQFGATQLSYLSTLMSGTTQLFHSEFINYLGRLRFSCDIDAMPEGTIAFPHEPIIRVTGPLVQAQLIETALLTMTNFPTLVATKSSRICQAAEDGVVLEFGLRRAQGIDGGVTASRAAYVGGCHATSNVLAGKLFDIPVKGTHAHSWVMAFDSELESFRAYAAAMPDNCVFLVDTYDTVQGVKNAIQVGLELKARGSQLTGVRLDSGDLVRLSRIAREMLDEAGLTECRIVASNDLDEYSIARLRTEGAAITTWGVGTRLATAYDQPALGGVYKLGAMWDSGSERWQPRMKVSDDKVKCSIPGRLQVRRFSSEGQMMRDVIYDESTGPPVGDGYEDLLRPLFRDGVLVADLPSATEARELSLREQRALPQGVRQFSTPVPYSVQLESRLDRMRTEMISQLV